MTVQRADWIADIRQRREHDASWRFGASVRFWWTWVSSREDQLEMLLGGAAAAARRDARADRHQHGPDHRRSVGPGPGRADGHAGGQPGDAGRSRPRCSRTITEPMAQLYRIIPLELRGQHADDRHVRSAEAVDHRRVAELPGLRHPGRWSAPRRRCSRRSSATTPSGGESVETLIADMEQDAELTAAVEGHGERRHARPDRASRPWPTAPRSASC